MRFRISGLVVSIIACLAISSAGAAAHPRHRLRLPADYAAWTQVAICESGGWQVLGSAYPDALGIDATNWADASGAPQPYGRVPLKARIAEIRVADRFIRSYHIAIPDQGGCHGSW